MSSKNNAIAAGRAISDRELESLLRRAEEYLKLRRSRLLNKKLQPIRKAPAA